MVSRNDVLAYKTLPWRMLKKDFAWLPIIEDELERIRTWQEKLQLESMFDVKVTLYRVFVFKGSVIHLVLIGLHSLLSIRDEDNNCCVRGTLCVTWGVRKDCEFLLGSDISRRYHQKKVDEYHERSQIKSKCLCRKTSEKQR
jgi:hypothetical protein